jgi:hypothetical protein
LMMRRILPALLAVTLFGASGWGHDKGTPYADWMMSLKRPDYPLSPCCGLADQYYVREYGPSEKKGVAFAAVVIGVYDEPDFSIDIPREKVVWDRVNPTGRGVIFIYDSWRGREVMCFVPGMGM